MIITMLTEMQDNEVLHVIEFQNLFSKSGGNFIVYNGIELHLVDVISLNAFGHTFKLTFEACDSEWRQGVLLKSKGNIHIDNQEIGNSVVLWQDTCPTVVEVSVPANSIELEIRNVWDTGSGVTHSWHGGAAMRFEELDHGKRYFCNDGHLDDDLNDLIFKLEAVRSD